MNDFDRPVERRGTSSVKWNVKEGELPMWIADMDFFSSPDVVDALVRRARHGVYGYTEVSDDWYEGYIGWWERRHGFRMEREWLQFCIGVLPAVSCLVKRFTNVGDNVVLFTPVYNYFFNSVENAGRKVLECPLVYRGGAFEADFYDLEEKLSRPRSTLFLLCNPHNPVGKIWTREELLRIEELCRKHGVLVLSDEIHCDITRPGTAYVPFASLPGAARSVTCLSVSKTFNLGGLQSAAVCVPDPSLREIAVRGLNADELAEPNCFAAEGAAAALHRGDKWVDDLREYLFENRAIAERALSEISKVRAVAGDATYLLWIDVSALTDDARVFCEFLRQRTGLILSDGTIYRGCGNQFVRMNLACRRAVLEDGLERFAAGVGLFCKERL